MAKESDWLVDFAIKATDESSRSWIESGCRAVGEGYDLRSADGLVLQDIRDAVVYLIRRTLNLDPDFPPLPFHISIDNDIMTFQDRDK